MAVFTLCYCGTSCWPDEGFVDRSDRGGSLPTIYGRAGYVPVGIHAAINSGRQQGKAVIPGVGEAWNRYRRELWVPQTVYPLNPPHLHTLDVLQGSSMWDLAGHAAASVVGVPSMGRGDQIRYQGSHEAEVRRLIDKLRITAGMDINPDQGRKPPSNPCYQFSPAMMNLLNLIQPVRDAGAGPISTINLIGHSRGAVTAIMTAWELYYLFPDARVNIFAIDPVPGTGTLSPEMTSLAPNVETYVGIYAIDEVSAGFNGVIPRPFYGGRHIDPLKPTPDDARRLAAGMPMFPQYYLIYAPGRHSTVSGNATWDGRVDRNRWSKIMEAVGILVAVAAQKHLKNWRTEIPQKEVINKDKVREAIQILEDASYQAEYRKMRQFTYIGNLQSPQHWNERGVTSSDSFSPGAWSYLEDVIGNEPLVPRKGEERASRPEPGLVRWKSLSEHVETDLDLGRVKLEGSKRD